MDPIAFVEVVDRHREVAARYPVYRWPVKVGRSYEADVVLDDAYLAPLHLEISPADEGRFNVTDPGSINGFSVLPASGRRKSAEIGPNDVVRLGHTQLRIRPRSFSVAEERPLRAAALYRRSPAFLAIAVLTILVFAWNAWIATTDENDRLVMLFPVAGLVVVVAVWISVWSFVSSALGRRANFAAHGFVACAGVIALIVASALFDYLAFGFDASGLQYVGGMSTAAILGYVVYRHLVLNSRAGRRNLAIAATAMSVVICGAGYGLGVAIDLTQEGNQHYSEAIKAPQFLFVTGSSTRAFIADAQVLQRKVDAMGKKQ
jgi:FHA domain